eukprot:696588-Rhodomonas_salina.1
MHHVIARAHIHAARGLLFSPHHQNVVKLRQLTSPAPHVTARHGPGLKGAVFARVRVQYDRLKC